MSTATANSKTMDGGASIHTASDITNGQKIQHNVHNIYIYVCILAQVNLNIVTYIKITYIWFRIAWHTRDTYIYPIQSYPNVFSVHIYIYIWLTFVLPVELIFISSNASVYLPALPPPKRIHFFFGTKQSIISSSSLIHRTRKATFRWNRAEKKIIEFTMSKKNKIENWNMVRCSSSSDC